MNRPVCSLSALALCLVVAWPALGQSTRPVLGGVPAASQNPQAEKAAFIEQYDDGESDVGYNDTGRATSELVMLFDGVGGPDVTLGSVDVCLYQVGSDPMIRYEVVVYAADGPGGVPGTELLTEAAVATGVTSVAAFDTTNLGFPLTETDVYIGVRWNPIVDPDFAFCVDRDGIGGAVQPGYYRANESGAWSEVDVAYADSDYNALMFRAFLSTPGVFAESLIVPSFLVDRTDPAGTTTLFAVRNLTSDPVSADVEYFTVHGVSQGTEELMLDPRETFNRNLRDVPGLDEDLDGFARGYVVVTTAGNPDMTPVLGGDFFQVDVGADFATGEKLARQIGLCTHRSIRFLNFPLPGSGTRLVIWIANPRGVDSGDPFSFTMRIYDEAGSQVGSTVSFKSSVHVLEIDPSAYTALGSGTLRFDFGNSSGGVLFAESSVEGRFSVGLTGQCDEMP